MTAVAPAPGAHDMRPEVLAAVRRSVRELLEATPSYGLADQETRRALAERMVAVSLVAARLADEDQRLTEQVRRRARPAFARAQSAGDQLGLQAVREAGTAIRSVKDSIDFPTYVGTLITGVFQAILSSTTLQLGSLGELLDNVSASAEDFEGTIGDPEVARWLVAKFEFLVPGPDGKVVVRPGVDLAEKLPQLQAGLGVGEGELGDLDPQDLEGSLFPLARRRIGRDKQQVLGTMIQMGLQRIVVDEGRIHASMDLRVDAQSGSQHDLAQRNDWRVSTAASGSFGVGPWSASASVSASVGQVKSDHQFTNEQLGVRAGLRSSVDLAFRTEQVPLDRLADEKQRVRLEKAARVPASVTEGGSILAPAPAPVSMGPLPMDAIPPPPTAPQLPQRPATNEGTPVKGATPTKDGAPPKQGAVPGGGSSQKGGSPPPQGNAPKVAPTGDTSTAKKADQPAVLPAPATPQQTIPVAAAAP